MSVSTSPFIIKKVSQELERLVLELVADAQAVGRAVTEYRLHERRTVRDRDHDVAEAGAVELAQHDVEDRAVAHGQERPGQHSSAEAGRGPPVMMTAVLLTRSSIATFAEFTIQLLSSPTLIARELVPETVAQLGEAQALVEDQHHQHRGEDASVASAGT